MDITNIHNDYAGYNRLIEFYHENKDLAFDTIHIDLGTWFPANTCSMLGAILSPIQNNFNKILIDAGKAKDTLEKNEFLSYFGQPKQKDYNNTTISYKILGREDDRFFNFYVQSEFLSKAAFPEMTSTLKKKLAESIYEIFNNAKMHSETEKIFACGQFYPDKNEIRFMMTDLGIGIRESVNRRFNSNLNAVAAIDWAMESGNTTRQGISGGIGLAILKEFIEKNKGELQVISNNGFWQFSEKKKLFNKEFPGTIVNITVRTDDPASYALASEVKESDIF